MKHLIKLLDDLFLVMVKYYNNISFIQRLKCCLLNLRHFLIDVLLFCISIFIFFFRHIDETVCEAVFHNIFDILYIRHFFFLHTYHACTLFFFLFSFVT
jgi:hypothetical protein